LNGKENLIEILGAKVDIDLLTTQDEAKAIIEFLTRQRALAEQKQSYCIPHDVNWHFYAGQVALLKTFLGET
jgi:hypothetical protein